MVFSLFGGVNNVKNAKNDKDDRNVKDFKNVKNAKNAKNVKNVKDANNTKNVKNVKNVSTYPPMQTFCPLTTAISYSYTPSWLPVSVSPFAESLSLQRSRSVPSC